MVGESYEVMTELVAAGACLHAPDALMCCHPHLHASLCCDCHLEMGRLHLVLLGSSTAQHSTAQHSTAQHSTAQHSTAQHSTAQAPQSLVDCSAAVRTTSVVAPPPKPPTPPHPPPKLPFIDLTSSLVHHTLPAHTFGTHADPLDHCAHLPMLGRGLSW